MFAPLHHLFLNFVHLTKMMNSKPKLLQKVDNDEKWQWWWHHFLVILSNSLITPCFWPVLCVFKCHPHLLWRHELILNLFVQKCASTKKSTAHITLQLSLSLSLSLSLLIFFEGFQDSYFLSFFLSFFLGWQPCHSFYYLVLTSMMIVWPEW